MRRPAYKTNRHSQQEFEVQQRKARFAKIELMPQHKLEEMLCQPCKTREPWIDICPECWAKIEGKVG